MARILVIDDSLTQCLWLTHLLQSLHHDVVATSDLQHAMTVADPNATDLVLMELLMHKTNGFEAGIAFKRKGFRCVYLMTNVDRETDAIWASAVGLEGVLIRPVSIGALKRAVDNALARTVVEAG